jgi:hypothetical protein
LHSAGIGLPSSARFHRSCSSLRVLLDFSPVNQLVFVKAELDSIMVEGIPGT